MGDPMQQTQVKGWLKAKTGTSREGREIAFYLPDNNGPGPLDTLIMGAFHGDEPESEVLMTHFMATFGPDEFAGRRVGIVPVVNPDGLALRQRVNAGKVDLNRNFPTLDWEELNGDTPYYSGPQAGSEPETLFILYLLDHYTPRKIVSVHTPYKVINYDGPGEPLAQAMSAINGYPVVADIGYSTPGSFGTFVGKERNIATITLELPEEGFNEAELVSNTQALRTAILWDSFH